MKNYINQELENSKEEKVFNSKRIFGLDRRSELK